MKMFTQSLKIATAVSTIGLGIVATPTAAQAMPMPTLSFPDAESGWGCRFTSTCEFGPLSTRENR